MCRPARAPVAGGPPLWSVLGRPLRGPQQRVPMSFVIAQSLGPSSMLWRPACLQLCICGGIMFGFAFLLVGTSTSLFGVWFVWRLSRPCGRATGCCGPWSSLTCCLGPAAGLWLTSGLVWTSVCPPLTLVGRGGLGLRLCRPATLLWPLCLVSLVVALCASLLTLASLVW